MGFSANHLFLSVFVPAVAGLSDLNPLSCGYNFELLKIVILVPSAVHSFLSAALLGLFPDKVAWVRVQGPS
jgi:hypothetical protein